MLPAPDPFATLLLVEDHPLYREGFRASVNRTWPDAIVHAASSGEEALHLIAGGMNPDLCLADLRLPGMDGLELLDQLRQRRPDIARALLCADPTAVIAERARSLGCIGCLSKIRDLPAIVAALEAMISGVGVFDADPRGALRITARRRRVLELAAEGKSNKQIARVLLISERTVKEHWTAIFSQMGVARRTEAVMQAQRLRLI